MASSSEQSPFEAWSHRWLELAAFRGATCPDLDDRIRQIGALWDEEIPPGWHRGTDARLVGAIRYGRTHSRGRPTPGSEHEVEWAVIGGPDHQLPATACLGDVLVDGLNAVPLTRDMGGKRAGNVEADLLLLTQWPGGYRQLLVEVKTGSNNAWYAVVENLRQLRLFAASEATQAIFHRRNPNFGLPATIPVGGVVLAPKEFYEAHGKRSNASAYAMGLIDRMSRRPGAGVTLSEWDGRDLNPYLRA